MSSSRKEDQYILERTLEIIFYINLIKLIVKHVTILPAVHMVKDLQYNAHTVNVQYILQCQRLNRTQRRSLGPTIWTSFDASVTDKPMQNFRSRSVFSPAYLRQYKIPFDVGNGDNPKALKWLQAPPFYCALNFTWGEHCRWWHGTLHGWCMHDVWYIYSAGPALFIHGITKAKMCAIRPVVLVWESNMQLASKVFAGHMCHILYVIIILFKSQIGTLNYLITS